MTVKGQALSGGTEGPLTAHRADKQGMNAWLSPDQFKPKAGFFLQNPAVINLPRTQFQEAERMAGIKQLLKEHNLLRSVMEVLYLG